MLLQCFIRTQREFSKINCWIHRAPVCPTITLKLYTIYSCGKGFDVVICMHPRRSLQSYRNRNSGSWYVDMKPHSKFLAGLQSKRLGTGMQISTRQRGYYIKSKTLLWDRTIYNTVENMGQSPTLPHHGDRIDVSTCCQHSMASVQTEHVTRLV
jgi:hypothetical protein